MHSMVGAVSASNPQFAPGKDKRAMTIFARTLFKDMVANGLSNDQIIALATQLLGHVTEDIKEKNEPSGKA